MQVVEVPLGALSPYALQQDRVVGNVVTDQRGAWLVTSWVWAVGLLTGRVSAVLVMVVSFGVVGRSGGAVGTVVRS